MKWKDFPIKVGNLKLIGNIKKDVFGYLSRRGVPNYPNKLGIIRTKINEMEGFSNKSMKSKIDLNIKRRNVWVLD